MQNVEENLQKVGGILLRKSARSGMFNIDTSKAAHYQKPSPLRKQQTKAE